MNGTPIYDEMTTDLVAFPEAVLADVSKGDTFTWLDSVTVTVTRVAADRSWADLHCESCGRTWSKRQPLPLHEGFTPTTEAG